MNEHEFTDTIEHATGKKLGIDYCFIIGTKAPWHAQSGFMSSSLVKGFYVNRREKDGSRTEKLLNPRSSEESLNQVLEFLKDTN
jgi:hypothetical protein